jgi:hypothetical protein
MSDDQQLDVRLGCLEARIPGAFAPNVEPKRRPVRLAGRSAVAASLLLLATVATTAAIAVVVSGGVRGWEGIENQGQPLYGANLECMTPKQAEAYLVSHGYRDIVWQIKSDDPSQPLQVSTAPDHGYVIPAGVIDGVMYVGIDQRASGHAVGACYGMPMP